MKYFTLTELTRSDTAEKMHIDNTPNNVQIKALEQLVDNVLDPAREKLGSPIRVTSGFRCERLNKAVGGARNSQHCVDTQTEILTDKGWRNIDNIQETDNVISVDYRDNKLKISPIKRIVKRLYSGELYCCSNNVIDYAVTDEHRMFIRYPETRNNITPNCYYHFETAEKVFAKRRKYQVSFCSEFTSEVKKDFLKLCLAVVADGCVHTTRGKYKDIVFTLKKERKIKALTELLDRLDMGYTIRYCKDREKQGQYGIYSIRINSYHSRLIENVIGRQKNIPFTFLYNDSKILEEMVKYYAFYDGYFDKRENCTGFTISTINKHNADVLGLMAIFSGYSCVAKQMEPIAVEIRGRKIKPKHSYYILSLAKRTECKTNENNFSKRKYNGLVWCVETENQTIITRRNGRIVLMGNCKGQATDITCYDNLKLIRILQNLTFDQLIWEKGKGQPLWIHVSFSNRNRRQKLKTYDGKNYVKVEKF